LPIGDKVLVEIEQLHCCIAFCKSFAALSGLNVGKFYDADLVFPIWTAVVFDNGCFRIFEQPLLDIREFYPAVNYYVMVKFCGGIFI